MFAFYDFETTGTCPAFDQPLQFAAILTDDHFNEVERIDFRCRLAPHILPAPWALAVTGVTPEMLVDPALPSWFEFTTQISDAIGRWAPATWTGYNTIAFDEEFLRQSFYQNLHPNLYQTQFNSNERLDLMKIVYAVRQLAPDILKWPTDDNGAASFKLDRLAPANGFAHYHAHDALGDVEATIFLARLVRDRAPEVWAECLRNRDKRQVNELLETGKPLQLVERFGAAPPRSYFGVYCGRNPDNPSSVGFLDLDHADPGALVDADDQKLAAAVSASPKLIRSVVVNKCPSLFSVDHPETHHLECADLVSARPDFHERVGRALAARFADRAEPPHVEQRIYGGFYDDTDRRLLERFQAGDWADRAALVEQIEDERLRQLGLRLIYLNAPELVSREYKTKAAAAIQERWQSQGSSRLWTTGADVSQQLAAIERAAALPAEQIEVLHSFYSECLDSVNE